MPFTTRPSLDSLRYNRNAPPFSVRAYGLVAFEPVLSKKTALQGGRFFEMFRSTAILTVNIHRFIDLVVSINFILGNFQEELFIVCCKVGL